MTACTGGVPARDLPPWQLHLIASKHLKRRLELNVYLIVLSHIGRNDWAYPSEETIARELSTRKDSVQKKRVGQIINALVKRGWMETRRRGRGATSLKRCLVPGEILNEFQETRSVNQETQNKRVSCSEETHSSVQETRFRAQETHSANQETRNNCGSAVQTAPVQNCTSTEQAEKEKNEAETDNKQFEPYTSESYRSASYQSKQDQPEVWENIKSILSAKIPGPFFRAFIEPCALQEPEAGAYSLMVPDLGIRRHVEALYLSQIAAALTALQPGATLTTVLPDEGAGDHAKSNTETETEENIKRSHGGESRVFEMQSYRTAGQGAQGNAEIQEYAAGAQGARGP